MPRLLKAREYVPACLTPLSHDSEPVPVVVWTPSTNSQVTVSPSRIVNVLGAKNLSPTVTIVDAGAGGGVGLGVGVAADSAISPSKPAAWSGSTPGNTALACWRKVDSLACGTRAASGVVVRVGSIGRSTDMPRPTVVPMMRPIPKRIKPPTLNSTPACAEETLIRMRDLNLIGSPLGLRHPL